MLDYGLLLCHNNYTINEAENEMGKLWTFRFFDGSSEEIRDGGLGVNWVREWALKNIPTRDVFSVSSLNFIRKGYEFF
jgi:hypothetical protein